MSRAAVTPAKSRKAWSQMNSAELAAATAGLEDLDYKETRPVSPAERSRSKRPGKARKLPWNQAMRAVAASDPALMQLADEVADFNGLKRSELISRALGAVIAAMKVSEPKRQI